MFLLLNRIDMINKYLRYSDMRKIILCLIFLFVLSNCQSQKVYFNKFGAVSRFPTERGMQSFFLFGLVETKNSYIDASKVCKGNEIVMVETAANLLDMWLSVVTFGIYTPRHYYLYCMDKEYKDFLKYKKNTQ